MNSVTKRSINLCGRTFEYELSRKKVKNINLRVKSDGSMCVSANSKVSIKTIEDFINNNAERIVKAIDKYTERARENSFENILTNESEIKVFGEYKKVIILESDKNSADLSDNKMIIYSKNPDDKELNRKILDKYLHTLCENAVLNFCDEAYPHFKSYLNNTYPKIKFKTMKSRWGSCNSRDKILTFNYLLVKAPPESVNYVVIHEFCHFIHQNHSKEFHNCVASFLPNWKELKNNLEK